MDEKLYPNTVATLRQFGIDHHRILNDAVTEGGYRELMVDKTGAFVVEGSKMLAMWRDWPSVEVKRKVADAMFLDDMVSGGFMTQQHPYPVDNVILLTRQSIENPTESLKRAAWSARTLLTPEQLDEYKTRYAKMYGEEAIHEGDSKP